MSGRMKATTLPREAPPTEQGPRVRTSCRSGGLPFLQARCPGLWPGICTLAAIAALAYSNPVSGCELLGVVVYDTGGSSRATFRPGERIRLEARVHIDAPGWYTARATLFGPEWSLDLEQQVGFRAAGTCRIFWEILLPAHALGESTAHVTIGKNAAAACTGETAFSVAAATGDYFGEPTCSACHLQRFLAWRLSRHAPFPSCEACHGPGPDHVLSYTADTVYATGTSDLCGECHALTTLSDNQTDNGTALPVQVEDGFIRHHQEYTQWRGTAHAAVRCVDCHDPHAGLLVNRASALRSACRDCHGGKQLRLHDPARVSCEDCHMPFAVRSQSSRGTGLYRRGDVRAHIWRIRPVSAPGDMAAPDGTSLAADAAGFFLTLDAACLGCHNGTDAVKLDYDTVRQTWRLIH